MPLKKVVQMLCPRCGKKTCDGSVWKVISVVPQVGRNAGKEEVNDLPPHSHLRELQCAHQCFSGGSAIKKMPTPQGPVGTKATRHWDNWVDQAKVTYEKVEE